MTDKRNVTLSMSAGLHDKVRALARDERRSISAEVETLVLEGLEHRREVARKREDLERLDKARKAFTK